MTSRALGREVHEGHEGDAAPEEALALMKEKPQQAPALTMGENDFQIIAQGSGEKEGNQRNQDWTSL